MNASPLRYLNVLLITATSVLGIVAVLNLVIDPVGVFRDDPIGPKRYAETLRSSRSGLWWPDNSYQDRAIKRALASHAGDFDCVVIGSSHVMQVSTLGDQPALSGLCRSALNLGVSGAVLEDHLTLAYVTLRNRRPAKVVLGVDPWIFAYDKDERWSYYAADYQAAVRAVLGEAGADDAVSNTIFSRIANLFSLEYTLQSLRKAAEDVSGNEDRRAIITAPVLDEKTGGVHPAFRPDGSLVYSAKAIAESKNASIPHGGITYKTGSALVQERAVSTYRALLRWIRERGAEPVLLLTPYHRNVLMGADSPNAVALASIEPLLRVLAREENVTIVGSYDPVRAGCGADEFIDFMHANPACLARLH